MTRGAIEACLPTAVRKTWPAGRPGRRIWDFYQVCTFASSATSIRSGAAIRLRGHVPGHGYATLYKRTTVAGQPATLSASGWTRVGTMRLTSTGKFISGYLHPTRTTWYVAKYSGTKFPAFTSVVKVSVR